MCSAETVARVETFTGLEALPADALPLFAASRSFFSTLVWWEAVLAHAMPRNARARLLLIRLRGAPCAIFPMIAELDGFRALTTPYTCLYEPLIAPETVRAAVFTAFAQYCRSFATTRIDGLDSDLDLEFAFGGSAAELAVARFDHFGNWHEDVSGLDWPAWLARRPGAPRETIRRRSRRAERLAGARFALFDSRRDMASGIAAFETVYARSWKEAEPFPAFNRAQIRAAAALGMARVGVWWVGETPAAAQFWIVEPGRATVLKLAHDEDFKAHSPGTVLTAWMIRHMIEHEHVSEIDFGRGDDPYKQGWVAERRQRTGLLLINPRYPRGMVALGRHALGRIKARLQPSG